MPTPIYCKPLSVLDPASYLSYPALHFHMSDEQQQIPREYSFQVVALPNSILPVPHNQPTMPRDRGVSSTYQASLWQRALTASGMSQTHPAPEISQDDIIVHPQAAHPAYYDPHHVGYAPPYYGPPVSLFT